MKRSCGTSRVVEDRAFRARADARQAQRAGVAVDLDRAERRARRQRDLALRHRRVLRAGARARSGASCACRRSSGTWPRARTAQRRRPRPDAPRRAPRRRRVEQRGSARPGSPAPARSSRRSASATRERLAYCGASAPVASTATWLAPYASAPSQTSMPDRRDVVHLERNDARRQAASAPRERWRSLRAPSSRVEQQAGVATAGRRVRRQQRPHARAEVRHARDTRRSSRPTGTRSRTRRSPCTGAARRATWSPSARIAAVEQTSMHCVQPTFCERLCAQIDAL